MTDWLPYKLSSGGLPTLQCVTTWRGYVAGTYPMQVYWAGTDGSLWRSTTTPKCIRSDEHEQCGGDTNGGR